MRYAIYMPPNTKKLRNKPAKRNKVRASKQLRFVAITKTFNGNQALAIPILTASKETRGL